MHNNSAFLEEVFYLAVLVAEGLTLVRFIRARAVSKWPSICIFLTINLAIGPILLAAHRWLSPRGYLNAYASADALVYAAQFFLIAQLYRPADRGLAALISKKRAAFLALLIVVGCLEFSGFSFPEGRAISAFFQAERALSFSRCILLGAIGVHAFITVTAWTADRVRIFIGLTLYAICQLLFFQTQVGSAFAGNDIAKFVPPVVYLATLQLWAMAASVPVSAPILTTEDMNRIKSTLRSASGRFERFAGEIEESAR